MKLSVLLTLAAVVTTTVPSAAALAQQPDSAVRRELQRQTRRQLLEMRNVMVRAPTLVVVAPLDTPDTLSVRTTGCSVAAANGMRCAQIVAGAHVVDPQYSTIALVPTETPIGYVLAAPSIRPVLVRGAVARSVLEDSVRAFWVVVRRPDRIR
ncbi:MAG: hypothetical protein NTW87_03725 [Planctomycetota bacterium]|nr:hypothetical protein [Planctomycetota bacterium]